MVTIKNSFSILIQSYDFAFALEDAIAPNFVMARFTLEVRCGARQISGKLPSSQIRLNRCMPAIDHTDQGFNFFSEVSKICFVFFNEGSEAGSHFL